MEMSKYKDLISLKDAGHKYGLSPTSLRIYILDGKLEGLKIGRNWVTTKEAVERYLKGRERYREPKKKLTK